MFFLTGVRRVILGVFLMLGFFSFGTVAEAAFSGALYPDKTIAPGDSTTLYAPMSGGTFPYVCTFSGTDGTNTQRTKATAQDPVTFSVSPDETTTYTLSCSDAAGGLFSESATITVSSTPVISSFTAIPSNELPASGGMIQIKANIALATRCTHTGGTSQYRSDKPFPNSGSVQYSPEYNITSTTTFSLECFNASGASSGKKSVTVFVGVSSTCGNGTVEKDKGEYCDLGTGNSNTCPVKCSTTCQSNGCDSVVDISMTARPDEFEPGETVKINWDAKDAERCDVVKGEGFQDPIGPSGSVTVKPTKTQSYAIECYDAGGMSQTGFVSVRVKVDAPDLSILSFRATPSSVPFSSADSLVAYSWNTKYDVEKANTSANAPTCSLGQPCKRDGGFCPYCADADGNISLSVVNGICRDGKTLLSEKSYRGSETINVARYRDGGNPFKSFSMGLLCRYGQRDEEEATATVFFESDPSLAPQVGIFTGGGKVRVEEGLIAAGAGINLHLNTLGADRCELRDSTGGKNDYPGFVGEKTIAIAPGVITAETVYTFECWRGTLSAQDTLTVKIKGASDSGAGNGNGSGSGPTSNTTCSTAGSTCQSGTFCANGATKVGSCNGGLGSCCMTGGTRADAGGPPGSAGNASSSNSAYFNPLKFDSVEGVLTGVITQLRNIIVILSIIFIIIGAVMYILSAGNESRMNTAKGAITAALIGLTLAIAAPAFLKEIASILGWTTITDASNTIQGAQTFSQIASKVLDFLLSIVGIIGIIMLVFGGFVYLTSAGDENKAETGKKIVTYAIIAIALALSALVLVTQVAKLFG